MELEELHVLEGQAGAVRHRHPVARDRLRVGGEPVEAAAAAGRDEQGLAPDRDRVARARVEANEPGEDPVVHEDLRDEQLVVPGEGPVALQLVVQRLHLEEAGLVGRQRRARVAVPAERPLGDVPVVVAGPRDPPVVQLADLLRDGVDECPDHVLVGEEVGSLHRVPGVQLARVAEVLAQDGRRAALGADRVGAHELDLRHDADVHLPTQAPGDLDRGAQPGETRAEDHHVVLQLAIHAGTS